MGVTQEAMVVRQYKVSEAKQAVSVDKDNFYVINNSTVHKYNKTDGKLTGSWNGEKEGIKHLNSGVIIDGKMYSANSNYPEIPMASSVEIFDTKTMRHIDSRSFGISPHGSLTWIDQKDGFWYIGFAHYAGKEASEGRDVRWTTLVKYTLSWQEVEAWVFPKNMIDVFTPKSNSGGSLGTDGKLYLTGHDKPELYIMSLPNSGYTLKYITTVSSAIHGQGVAIDHSVKNKVVIYGLNREANTVIVEEIR